MLSLRRKSASLPGSTFQAGLSMLSEEELESIMLVSLLAMFGGNTTDCKTSLRYESSVPNSG